jgi:hypothetical protein
MFAPRIARTNTTASSSSRPVRRPAMLPTRRPGHAVNHGVADRAPGRASTQPDRAPGASWNFGKIALFPPQPAAEGIAGSHTMTTTIDEHEGGVVTMTQANDAGPPAAGAAPQPAAPPQATPQQAAPPNACHIQGASFATIPSGAVPATLSGNTLGAAFTMKADFTPSIPCTCSCGEYRQYVRGTFTANGHPLTHSLGGGRTLHPTNFQEDGDVAAGTAYGHRSVPGTKSNYTPDQAGGCHFEGADEPGVSGAPGTVLGINLGFHGDLIDTCRGNTVLATSSWTVSGNATVP